MTTGSATATRQDGGGGAVRPEDCLAEINRLIAISSERFIESRGELLSVLARCGTAGDAAVETSAWLQKRLAEVAEENQRLFVAWMRLALEGWRSLAPAGVAAAGDSLGEPLAADASAEAVKPVPERAPAATRPERAAA